MMIDTWILVVVAIAFAAMSGIALRCLWKVGDMEGKLWTLKDRCSRLEDREIQHVGMIDKTNAEIEKVKGTIDAISLVHGKQLSDFERRLQGATEGSGAVLIKAINRLVEVVDNLCDRESMDWVGSENKANSDSKKPILDGEMPEDDDVSTEPVDIRLSKKSLERMHKKYSGLFYGDTDGDKISAIGKAMDDVIAEDVEELEEDFGLKIMGYRWIFPTVEHDMHPVTGQRYQVVGIASEKGTICTENAAWNGIKFLTESGYSFDKVYAYIRMPDSSDIMEQVVQLAIKDQGK